MTAQPDRIISLLKQSEHPVRNSILFAVGWVFLMLLEAILMLVIVIPRVQGYVTVTLEDDSMNKTFSSSDLLVFQKVRQVGAQSITQNDIVAFQPNYKETVYKVGKVATVTGANDDMEFSIQFDDNPNAQVTADLDMMRGKLVYKVPFFGATSRLWPAAAKSFMLILVAQLLLIYAGWQIGTSLINARDPQRQARAARLRTAALAGNLETTRQRLRRQGLR